jgi:hypothetical protein
VISSLEKHGQLQAIAGGTIKPGSRIFHKSIGNAPYSTKRFDEAKRIDIVRKMDIDEQHASASSRKQRKDVLEYLNYALIFSGTSGFTSVVTRISSSTTLSPCDLPASLISWSLTSASLLDSPSATLYPLEC